MLIRERKPDHFMVGEEVQVGDERGEIKIVVEHTIENDDGDRITSRRVVVDLGDREIDVSSEMVEAVR